MKRLIALASVLTGAVMCVWMLCMSVLTVQIIVNHPLKAELYRLHVARLCGQALFLLIGVALILLSIPTLLRATGTYWVFRKQGLVPLALTCWLVFRVVVPLGDESYKKMEVSDIVGNAVFAALTLVVTLLIFERNDWLMRLGNFNLFGKSEKT